MSIVQTLMPPFLFLSLQFTDIGVVTSLEVNHKSVEVARQGVEVCIRIESTGDAPRLYGRHFDHTDTLVSKVRTVQKNVHPEGVFCCRIYTW